MPDTATLGAEPRGQAGKGAARALRRQGRVPAILYGAGEAPSPISLDPGELSRLLARRGFFAMLVVTDSIVATEAVRAAHNIRQVTIAPLMAEAIRRISEERSVSSLFD